MMLIKLVDARKGLHEKCIELFHDEKVAESIYMYLCDGLEECDVIEPERKTGKWVRDPKSNRWRCSECCSFALRTDYREECLSDYCSVCGVYMKGEPNED